MLVRPRLPASRLGATATVLWLGTVLAACVDDLEYEEAPRSLAGRVVAVNSPPSAEPASSERPNEAIPLPECSADLPPTIALQHIDVRGEVVGTIAEIEVEQTFTNTYGERLEAIYVFPLPENAAIRDLVMVAGERRIRADLLERDAAREVYEAARERGRIASLLEQERPNIFTMSVANLEPGAPISVVTTYVDPLEYADGRYRFAFPTVVAPLFIPGEPTDTGVGGVPNTDPVPDACRITPPVLGEAETTPYAIDFSVDVFAGMPVHDLESASHVFELNWSGEQAVTVTLAEHEREPNRDIAFTFALADEDPAMGVLSHFDERGGFFLLLVEPPVDLVDDDVRPKELVFVIDTSGSMSGRPLDTAKGAMRHAIGHLNPNDTFQIIRFSDGASSFAPAPVRSTPGTVAAGLAFVEALRTDGGTQMIRGIEAALAPDPDPDRMRVVLFLTDGFIGNESDVLATVDRLVGGSRLFALGVGSSVNRFLLDQLAEVGRGTVHYVDIHEDPTDAVEAFYRRVRRPVLTDVEIDWGGLEVSDLTPVQLPDVFEGTPLVVTGRYSTHGTGLVVIRGLRGRSVFELLLDVDLLGRDEHPELAYLWARRQIDELERRVYWARGDDVRQPIIDLSLEYRVLTQYTSFVAVDEHVSAGRSVPLHTVATPVALPEGMIGPGQPLARMFSGRDFTLGEDFLTAGNGDAFVVGRGSAGLGLRNRGGHGVEGFGHGPIATRGLYGADRNGDLSADLASGRGVSANLGHRGQRAPRGQVLLGEPEVRVVGGILTTGATAAYEELAADLEGARARIEVCVGDEELARDLVLRVTVSPTGVVLVVEVEVIGDRRVDEAVRDCLLGVVRGLRFAPFEGDGVMFLWPVLAF